jgi:group II intron reverse transcriptase/maturase
MERVAAHANLEAAMQKVMGNKGSAGVDGMSTKALPQWFLVHGEALREQLLSGTWTPTPVRRVDIPKPDGGVRSLGIPTVVDRMVQQAVLQVLQPLWDPTFSTSSYGFRPGRSAHDALRASQQFAADGYKIVVDVDLEKFFDRVNHDVLMSRVERRIEDKRLLRLIRRFLNIGVMLNGVIIERHEGTPQGGPLSPLLANVLLDEVDKELERRGHRFARYADDCNVYVKTRKAGERVMKSLKMLYGRLHLRINEAKSAVAHASKRTFLGVQMYGAGKAGPKWRVPEKSQMRFKDRIRELTGRNCGRAFEAVAVDVRRYIGGWSSYFQIAATEAVFDDLDKWVRRRLRCLIMKQRHPRGSRSWWAMALGANSELPVAWFDSIGIPRLLKSDLNDTNRRMRTRMSGGVGGDRQR